MADKPIRVLWLHTGARGGCGAYRAIVPALALADRGGFESDAIWHEQVTDLSPQALHRLTAQTDVIVLQRATRQVFVDLIKHCRQVGIGTVIELDDHLFAVPRGNPAAPYYRTKGVQRVLRESLTLCDQVIVSTRPLRRAIAEEAGIPHTKITVAHNFLHESMWGDDVFTRVTPKHPGEGQIVIGWQGSSTHDADFGMAVPGLQQILAEFPQTRLRFFGYVPVTVKGKIPLDRWEHLKAVPLEAYPATLKMAAYDIGLAPLTDNAFNRGKSNLKWLEYSRLGVPCVASAVYPYAVSIEHGVTGFLAPSPADWYEPLRQLVVSATLRQTMGEAAAAHVAQHWGPSSHIESWVSVLTKAAAVHSVEALLS